MSCCENAWVVLSEIFIRLEKWIDWNKLSFMKLCYMSPFYTLGLSAMEFCLLSESLAKEFQLVL